MTFDESWSALEAELANLRVHDVAPDRAERIRSRCVRGLTGRRSRGVGHATFLAPWLEPALAVGLSAAFVAAAVGHALPLLR